MAEYVTVGKIEDLPPGERAVVEFGRTWVLIFNVDGAFYAIDDNCTHEEYPLSEGELDCMEIECRKHGARFDIRTGEVTAPPAFQAVKTYPVRVENGEIQVYI